MATPNQQRRKPPVNAPSSTSSTQSSSSRLRGSAGSPQHSQRSRATRPRTTSASHRHASSVALMQQKLAEMGSYAKYYKAITQNPFQVKIRCACGRSRNMAWMFLCTWCATGTKVEKKDKDKDNKEKDKDTDNKSDDTDNKEKEPRTFLSCDLCAQKMTESYYCPHCLAAYPAHYVKLHTRCTRCVSCPVCVSALEKIVYSGSHNTSASSDGKPRSDVYLYQCPFCFWSSNIVGLEASESDALLENLKEKLKRPVEEKTLIMTDIKKKYLTQNEELRREEDRIEKSKRFHSYKGGRGLFGAKHRESFTLQPSMSSGRTLNALESIAKKLHRKYTLHHVLEKESALNKTATLDPRYVSQFHLRNVSPLEHRLNDPLNQKIELDCYVPQRFHLMTKESYKCPHFACGKYVCKPTLRGRQANYDKRTAVLDYLPRINIEFKSGAGLMTGTESVIVVFVQNRHLYEASFKFDVAINDNDLYSTAKIECSAEWFQIDPADIHIQGGVQKDIKKANGDYVKGKEAAIHFKITPKHYQSKRNIKFSVKCLFKTKLQLKDDKEKDKDKNKDKNKKDKPLIDALLPYILDFELGEPKTSQDIIKGNNNLASINEDKDSIPTTNTSMFKSRGSTENVSTQ